MLSSSNTWTYTPPQGKPATPLLIVSEAAPSGPLGLQGYGGQPGSVHGGSVHGGGVHGSGVHGGAMHMDSDHHTAAQVTSTNVAESVLGSSPQGVLMMMSPPKGGVGGLGLPSSLQQQQQQQHGHAAAAAAAALAAAAAAAAVVDGSGSRCAADMTMADHDAHAARLADEMTAGVLD
jgi:hypothetical protein